MVQVKNFQPYYTFNPRRMEDLRTGTAILKEFVDLEAERAERAARSKVDQKAVAAEVANQVRQNCYSHLHADTGACRLS